MEKSGRVEKTVIDNRHTSIANESTPDVSTDVPSESSPQQAIVVAR